MDGELSEKLDKRSYVSLSKDRTARPDTSRLVPLDPDVNEEDLSLFAIGMPGNLTLDQVKALDLDHWLLLVHGTFVEMNVSYLGALSDLRCGAALSNMPQDLVGWEDMPIDQPQSIKGIIAELASVLGPSIVKNSAVVLFG